MKPNRSGDGSEPPRRPAERAAAPDYWRSLDELAQTPEFLERMANEFPAGATELLGPGTRRNFLRMMGASLALAGLAVTGCRWPKEKLAPYSYSPENVRPGEP